MSTEILITDANTGSNVGTNTGSNAGTNTGADFGISVSNSSSVSTSVSNSVSTSTAPASRLPDFQALEYAHGARNYHPLPVVFTAGSGVWLTDTQGRRVMDMMSAYSALPFGHCHPRLVQALCRQAATLTLTSRAVCNDKLGLLLQRLCAATGMDRALPMNTGMEAVETALKAARKWAYTVKGVAPEQAGIIACDNNFHGRSTLIVGLSSDAQYRAGFGPFPGGLHRIPFGDSDALQAAITPQTAAFLVEPIQGEGGIHVPPPGYLQRCRDICTRNNVLLLVDEVQTGLGRTGRMLACDHDAIKPDGLMLGKALGGGLYPVSAFLARREIMDVFQPGDHGSTFGGNPLGSAVALAVLHMLDDKHLMSHVRQMGQRLADGLRQLQHPLVVDIRGRGLMMGLEIDTARCSARSAAETFLQHGILTKDTHGCVLRLAPALNIKPAEIDWALTRISAALDALAG